MNELTLTGAIILQVCFTAYYIFFLIRPLCEIEKISGKINYGYRLLILRILVIIGINIFDHKLATLLDTTLLVVLTFIVSPQIKKDLNYVHAVDSKFAKYDELTDEELSAHGIKSRKLLEETLFKKLALVQTARSTYDYETIKRLCTIKMSNLFSSELRMVQEAKIGYHYEDYKLLEVQIYGISSTENDITIKAAIKASCIFYREAEDGELLDGSKTNRTIIAHELEYIKDIKQQQIDQNCPNCGAPTKATVKGKCQYCNTIINQEYSGWHISKHKLVAEQIVENI